MIKLKEEFKKQVQTLIKETIEEELNDTFDDIHSDINRIDEFKESLEEKLIGEIDCFDSLSDQVSSLVQYVSDGQGGFVDSLELRESIENIDNKINSITLPAVDNDELHTKVLSIYETLKSHEETKLKSHDEQEEVDQWTHIYNAELRISSLEKENQELKDRLSSIENFLLNLSEGFKNA